jgi:hypothetical protein
VATASVRRSERGGDLQWLFPYVPDLVGAGAPKLVLGKYSGMANVDWALERMHVIVPEQHKAALLAEVKAEGIRLHRTLSSAEFASMAQKFVSPPPADGTAS